MGETKTFYPKSRVAQLQGQDSVLLYRQNYENTKQLFPALNQQSWRTFPQRIVSLLQLGQLEHESFLFSRSFMVMCYGESIFFVTYTLLINSMLKPIVLLVFNASYYVLSAVKGSRLSHKLTNFLILLCCGMLGEQHQSGKHQQTGQKAK